MTSVSRRGSSAITGKSAQRVGSRTYRRPFSTAVTVASATRSGGVSTKTRHR